MSLMKRLCVLILFCVSIYTSALAAGGFLTSLSGIIETKKSDTEGFKPASAGMRISPGQFFKVGPSGKIHFKLSNGTKIWVRGPALFKISKSKWQLTEIKISSGMFKIKTRLKKGEILRLTTARAVYLANRASFVINAGSGDLQVAFGSVKAKSLKNKRFKRITQGTGIGINNNGGFIRATLLSFAQEINILSDWSPQTGIEPQAGGLKKKMQVRNSIRKFAFQSSKTEKTIAYFTNHLKESDIEAARTLKDIHGNLVRVEQRILRPKPNSVQFVNIVKRPSYNNNAGNFAYNGTDNARLDVFQSRVEFSKNLPRSINDWNGFFESGGIIAKCANLVMSDHSNAANIYMIGFLVDNKQYDPSTGIINPSLEDELVSGGKFYFGTVNKNDYNKFANFQVDKTGGLAADGSVKDFSSAVLNGLVWAQDPAATGGWNELNPLIPDSRSPLHKGGDDNLYQYKAHPYCVGADCSQPQNLVWLAEEYYVIAANGGVLNIKDITGSGVDFTTLANNIAGQGIFYVKNHAGAFDWYQISDQDANLQTGAFFTNPGLKNIDMVLIPDAPYQMLEKAFTAVDLMNDE
jgi:hypothetical protein